MGTKCSEASRVLVLFWYFDMATIALHRGLHMKIKYLLSQDGSFYYQRRVPDYLRDRYGRANIKIPLKTLEPIAAAKAVAQLAAAHDKLWRAMVDNESLLPVDAQGAGRRLLADYGLEEGIGLEHPAVDRFLDDIASADRERGLKPVERIAYEALKRPLPLLLSEGLNLYLNNHQKGGNKRFVAQTTADWKLLINAVGDISVATMDRDLAKKARDELLKSMKTTSVARRINTFRAVFTSILRETNSERRNPFEGLQIKGVGEDAKERLPYSESELKTLLKRCKVEDDERRRLIVLLAFTGMRLAEPLGLLVDDLVLEHPVPHLVLRRHPWRSLKNANSERLIPLAGYALEVATKIKAESTGRFCFPAYANEQTTKANSASATLNKWIKSVLGTAKTCHELRHTMSDRLKHVGAPKDVIVSIGGWAKDSVGDHYGQGHSLKTKAEHLTKAYAGLLP